LNIIEELQSQPRGAVLPVVVPAPTDSEFMVSCWIKEKD